MNLPSLPNILLLLMKIEMQLKHVFSKQTEEEFPKSSTVKLSCPIYLPLVE